MSVQASQRGSFAAAGWISHLRKLGLCIAFAAVVLLAPRGARAEAHEGHDGEHPNHAAFFIGFTNVELHQHRASELTFGAEYEMRLPMAHGAIGFGPSFDVAVGEETLLTTIGSVYLHPWHGLKLFAGAGFEHAHGHNYALWRGGVAYDFHMPDGGCVTPLASIERVDAHTAYVAGLSLGYTF